MHMVEIPYEIVVPAIIVAIFLLAGIKIIRPTHVAAVETLGKYTGFKTSGITYIIPAIQRLYAVNITEQMVDITRQDVITKDNLNCTVDAQVYFRVGRMASERPGSTYQDGELTRVNEADLKSALYHVNNYEYQIVQLARTTLRNVIGANDFKSVNSNRAALNGQILKSIQLETDDWGIGIVRVELKEVAPPKDVQETMNMVIKAQNDKQSAVDFANAVETRADGEKRASIKMAEGEKRAQIERADGEAQAIIMVAKAKAEELKLVNEAAQKYFKDEAQVLERLRVTRDALAENSKIVLTEKGISPQLVLNETGERIIPTKQQDESA